MSAERTVFYAAGSGEGDGRHCRFCGADLSPEQIGNGICGALDCHDRMIDESARAILARKRAKHDQVTEGVLAQVPEQIAEGRATLGADALIWMVPAQHDPLVPLPEERIARFREHMDFCATMAFDAPEGAVDQSAHEKYEPDEVPLAGAACATCQGRCCRDRGGDTALLLPDDFTRYRQRNPGTTKEQAIEAYLSHLPDQATRDGCVYQAITGCALPREMRQHICNSYYCDPLRWLKMASDEAGIDRAVLVAAHEGVPERVVAVDAGGVRTQIANLVEDVE